MSVTINEQRLIACVERYPLLYNPRHPDYLDFERKTEVWTKIADTLGFSVNKCKSRWSSMRDNYRKALRRNKMRGQNGEAPTHYKHAKRLQFVRKFLRATGDIDEDDPVVELKREVDDGDEMETVSCSGSQGDLAGVPQESEFVDYFSEDLEQTMDAQPRPVHLQKAEHPVDAFLGCIGAMVKALSPYYQAMAKAEIFAAAHKYELLCITQPTPRTSGAADGPSAAGTSSEAVPFISETVSEPSGSGDPL